MLPREKSCQIFQKRMSFPPEKKTSSSVQLQILGFCAAILSETFYFTVRFGFETFHTHKNVDENPSFDILSISLLAVKMAPPWADPNPLGLT